MSKTHGRKSVYISVAAAVIMALCISIFAPASEVRAAVLFSDDFEDGNANGWTVVNGTWSVASETTEVYQTTTTSGLALTVAGDTGWTDYAVEAGFKINSVGTTPASGIAFRYQGSGNYYLLRLQYDQQKVKLYKAVSGSLTLLDEKAYTISLNQWYTLKAEADGSSIKGYVDGVEQLSAADGSYTWGQIGFRDYGADTSHDDVIVSDFVAGPVVHEWEFENYQVGRETSGETNSTNSDSLASGGKHVLFQADGTGDWIQFTVPEILPGAYTIKLAYKQHTQRGKAQLSIGQADGTSQVDVGSEINMAGPDGVYTTTTIGTYSFGRMGFKTFKFRVTGDNAGVYKLSFDKLILEENFSGTVNAPTGLSITQTGASFFDLGWTDQSSNESGFLIERSSSPYAVWEAVGYTPANTTGFTAVGMKDSTAYKYRVIAYNSGARSPASNEVTGTTASASHTQQGTTIETGGSRSGEGTLVKLDNGDLLMLYNYQDTVNDYGLFKIYEKRSTDDGATWTTGTEFMGDSAGDYSYMMPSLLRLNNGSIGLLYSQRDETADEAHRYYQYSTDEGAHWSSPVKITSNLPMTYRGYNLKAATGPHDRLIQTSSGRLIFPQHVTTGGDGADPQNDQLSNQIYRATFVYSSTDNGQSWEVNAGPLTMKGTMQTYSGRLDQVLMEPSIVETSSNHLLMYMRNQSGFFYYTTSADDGETWSSVRQSPVRSALAPAKLVKIDSSTIGLIFNPYVDFSAQNNGDRFVLGTMYSTDGGETWENFRELEFRNPSSTTKMAPSYPYVLFDGSDLHIGYFGLTNFDMIYRKESSTWFTD